MMDQTVEKTGFMSGGKGEEKFKSIINQYIAKDIATSPTASIGIAKQMYEQMKKYV
jgi:Rod binding domain-containing protein